MAWQYTGKGAFRSAKQIRQNTLFRIKGQITAMQSVVAGAIGCQYLPEEVKGHLVNAYLHIKLAIDCYDKAVGWEKKEEKSGVPNP